MKYLPFAIAFLVMMSGAFAVLVAPTQVSNFVNATGLLGSYDIEIVGNLGYVVATDADTLSIFNLTDVHSPVLLSSITTGLSYPYAITVMNNTAYIANYDVNNITAINVTNPAAPAYLNSTNISVNTPNDIVSANGYIYVVSRSSSNLTMYNVTGNNQMKLYTSYANATAMASGSYGVGIYNLSNTQAWVGVTSVNGIAMFFMDTGAAAPLNLTGNFTNVYADDSYKKIVFEWSSSGLVGHAIGDGKILTFSPAYVPSFTAGSYQNYTNSTLLGGGNDVIHDATNNILFTIGTSGHIGAFDTEFLTNLNYSITLLQNFTNSSSITNSFKLSRLNETVFATSFNKNAIIGVDLGEISDISLSVINVNNATLNVNVTYKPIIYAGAYVGCSLKNSTGGVVSSNATAIVNNTNNYLNYTFPTYGNYSGYVYCDAGGIITATIPYTVKLIYTPDNTSISFCDGVNLTNASYVFKTYTEQTNLDINLSDYYFTADIYNATQFLYTKSLVKLNASNMTICIKNGSENLTVNAQILYSSNHTGVYYPLRSTYLTNASFTFTQQNLSLYLLPYSSATLFGLYVRDEYDNGVGNITVAAQRLNYNSSAYITMTSVLTDENGYTNIYLEADTVYYTFIIYEDGAVIKAYSPRVVSTSPITLTYATFNTPLFNYFNNLAYDCVYDNATTTIRATVTDPSGLMTNGILYVYNENGTQIGNASGVGSALIMGYSLDDMNLPTPGFRYATYVTIGGVSQLVCGETVHTRQSVPYGKSWGMILMFLMMLTALLVSGGDRSKALIFALVAVVLSVVIGFVDISWSLVAVLGIIIGVMVLKMK